MQMRSMLTGILLTLVPAGVTALAQEADRGREEGWKLFEERLGAGLALERVPGSGTDVEARGALRVAPSIRTAEERARATARVLAAAEELLGVPPASLVAVLERELGGMHVVQLEQRVEGVAVRGARVDLRLLEDGRLVLLRARDLAQGPLVRGFFVERADARELARIALPANPARLSAVAARALALRGDDGRPRAAWEVDVLDWTRPDGAWIVTLDGADGTLVGVRSGLVDALDGAVDGRGMASGPQISGAPAVLPIANAFVTALDRSLGLVRITDDGCEDTEVVMSADGSRIAWVSDCDGDREIWTSTPDGSGKLQLTLNGDDDHSPVLSADGSLVVFVSDRDGDEELFAVGSDGTGLVQLTSNAARDREPSLSGDGARVVYLSDEDGDDEVFTLLVAAPAPTQLTFDLLDDESPRLSLDGTRIVWISRAGGDPEIFTMDPTGGSVAQVTVNGIDDLEPAISPDGTRVAFASVLPPLATAPGDPSAMNIGPLTRLTRRVLRQLDLFEAAADGTSLRRLTATAADERAPAYSADGLCIAYTSDEDGDREVVLLDLSTGDSLLLTENASDDSGPRPGPTCDKGAWIANDGDGEIWVWDLSAPGALASATTDAAGGYSMPLPDGLTPTVSVALRGLWARVHDLDPRWGEQRASGSYPTPSAAADLHMNPVGAVEGPTAQVTAYRHTDLTHDSLETVMRRAPLSLGGPLPIDQPLVVRANFPQAVANAFYSLVEHHTTFFIGGGPARPNTAYDTLVMHETLHFYDDMIGGLGAGSICESAGALAEGQADVGALLVGGSGVIGADFFGAGIDVRDYTTFPWSSPVDPFCGFPVGAKGRQYDCLDCPGSVGAPCPTTGPPEIHFHGQAFAGFAWDLRTLVGAATAEDLLVGVLLGNPGDMQSAVTEAFVLASMPAFGGTGDIVTSPLFPSLCTAAAMHGFDCPPVPDFGSRGCVLGVCGPLPASHKVIGSEWLGASIASEVACEPVPSFEDDGVSMPSTLWMGGLPITLTFTLSVNPALQGSGRYGAPVPNPQLPERRVFLNAWLFIDDTMGGFIPLKVLGTGSGSGILGPDSFEPGLDAVAFNPDTWGGTSLAFMATITPPVFAEPRPAILRVRVDYGEDVGRLTTCLSDPTLAGPCGVARWGEVEDYQVMIVP